MHNQLFLKNKLMQLETLYARPLVDTETSISTDMGGRGCQTFFICIDDVCR